MLKKKFNGVFLMNTVFDTLSYSNELKEAGMEPHLAETQARALARVIDEKIVTKEHFDASLKDIDSRFKDIDVRFKEVDNKFKELEYRLTIKLGGMMVVAVAVVATLVKIL